MAANSSNFSNSYCGATAWNYEEMIRRLISVPLIVVICLFVILVDAYVLWATTALIRRPRVNPVHYLMYSFTLADLYTIVLTCFSLFYNSFVFYVLGFFTNACVSLLVEALRFGGMVTCALHLSVWSYFQYSAFDYRKNLTSASALIWVVIIWTAPPCAFFIYAWVVPGYGFLSPYNARFDSYCTRIQNWATLSFRASVTSVFFAAPFVVMTVLYVYVIIMLWRRKAPGELTETGARKKRRDKRRTLTTIASVWSAFFIGWLPTTLLYNLLCCTCLLKDMLIFSNFLTVINVVNYAFILGKSLATTFIYARRIGEVREACKAHNKRMAGYALCAPVAAAADRFLVGSSDEQREAKRRKRMSATTTAYYDTTTMAETRLCQMPLLEK